MPDLPVNYTVEYDGETEGFNSYNDARKAYYLLAKLHHVTIMRAAPRWDMIIMRLNPTAKDIVLEDMSDEEQAELWNKLKTI